MSEIRGRTNGQPLEVIIANRQLRWTGHVIPIPSNRLPRLVMYGQLEDGRRSVGGQHKRFKDPLKARLKMCHILPDTIESMAADRTGWRDA